MIRLCAFGNSHLASLKTGWDTIAHQFPHIAVTFVGSRQNGLAGLAVKDGKLVPQTDILKRDLAYTSGGLAEIDPAVFDAYFVYALGFLPPQMPSAGEYSSGFIAEAVRDSFEKCLAFQVCKLIRSLTAKPILVGHTPLTASAKATDRLKPYAFCELPLRAAVAKHGYELVAQPPETISEMHFTRAEYSVGSRRLDVGDADSNQLHPDADLEHMNGDFGRLVMKDVADRLRAA